MPHSEGVPLVDLGEARDVFLTGLARVERLPGNCLRFVWYVEEVEGGERRRVVKHKAVVPESLLPAIMRKICAHLQEEGLPIDSEFRERVHAH